MTSELDVHKRYLQIAFNYDIEMVNKILPAIPRNDRIMIEAGTPFIKRYGTEGIRSIARQWKNHLVADLKVIDGAVMEVTEAANAGATAATIIGNASTETLNLFISECKNHGIISMIDMINVDKPMASLRGLTTPPGVVVLHRGRDEESRFGAIIQYKHISKIKSKYDVLIGAAGGVDLREARSAIFNGANIVVANIVRQGDPWVGIPAGPDVGKIATEFLETID